MDNQKLCLKIEQATKGLTPLSVTLLEVDGRLVTSRIVAEAFHGMKLPQRIAVVFSSLNEFDPSILKTFDLTFELLSPVENQQWNEGKDDSLDSKLGNKRKIAAKDLDL